MQRREEEEIGLDVKGEEAREVMEKGRIEKAMGKKAIGMGGSR